MEGKAGKFSLVTVGGVAVDLVAEEVVGLGKVMVAGPLDVGLVLAFLNASSLVLYRGQPL